MSNEQTRNTPDRSTQDTKNPLLRDLIAAGTPPELIARVGRLTHRIAALKAGMGIAKVELARVTNKYNNIKLGGGRGREGLERKEEREVSKKVSKEVSKRVRGSYSYGRSEREQYGELLQSVRSDGLRQLVASRISDAKTGGQGGNSRIVSGSFCQISIRDSETGGWTNGHPGRLSNLYSNGGAVDGMDGTEKSNPAAAAIEAVTITDTGTDN